MRMNHIVYRSLFVELQNPSLLLTSSTKSVKHWSPAPITSHLCYISQIEIDVSIESCHLNAPCYQFLLARCSKILEASSIIMMTE